VDSGLLMDEIRRGEILHGGSARVRHRTFRIGVVNRRVAPRARLVSDVSIGIREAVVVASGIGTWRLR
jgi:hypothetical protein